MVFQLKIFTIRIILVAVVMLSLMSNAAAQRRTPKKSKTRVSWKENPLYVQAFVSKMMSKHPFQDVEKEPGADGMSEGPNLGFEPYWFNVPDRSIKDKCARCPVLFKRYPVVCAVDSTGDVMVNISMCKLLQMNCLNGQVTGSSTGIYGDFKDDYFVVSDGWARFAVRQDREVVVQLSNSADNSYPKYSVHTVVIDGWGTWWSGLYKNDYPLQWNNNWKTGKALYSSDHFTEFVIHWNATGWFLMTRSDYSDWRDGFHFNLTDGAPFPVRYIAVGGTQGYKGDWIIKDLPAGFIVTQLNPCASHIQGQARPVPTSPTHVPNILSRHSPINIGFFSRVEAAGVKLEKVSFLTREEY